MSFSREQIKGLFDQIDADKSGQLSQIEIKKMLKMLNQPDDDVAILDYFEKYNKDGDNTLNFEEFYNVFKLKDIKSCSSEELGKKFDQMDKDKSGFLEAKEVMAILKSSGYEDAQVERDMKALDKSGDGKISKGEFVKYFKK